MGFFLVPKKALYLSPKNGSFMGLFTYHFQKTFSLFIAAHLLSKLKRPF